ncbi:MAG: hypothetical protein AAF702_13980 [Chloroflexota bacterium]
MLSSKTFSPLALIQWIRRLPLSDRTKQVTLVSRSWLLLPVILCTALLLFLPAFGGDSPCTNEYCVDWWGIGGGGTSSGDIYELTSLSGQVSSYTDLSGGIYNMQSGFWIQLPDVPNPATDTPVPSTDTPVPPTATPTETDSPPEQPSATPVAPTATDIPSTATATATATVAPDTPAPTNTATPTQEGTVDTCTGAQAIATNGVSQEQFFDKAGDVNWVRFDAAADVNYRIEVQIPVDSTADVNLELYMLCDNTRVDEWSATFNPGARLDFESPTDSTVYVRLANYDALIFGQSAKYQVSVRDLQEDSANNATIIVAGRLRGTDRLQTNIHNITDAVYKMFLDQGYEPDTIQYLATDSALTGYDSAATESSLRASIVTWATERVSQDGVLNLYMVDHGSPENFYIDEVSGQRVSPAELDGWLTEFEEAICAPATCANPPKINVIIEACQSGSFIDSAGGSISQVNRTIITSTSAENDARASRNGAYFSDHLITSLSQGKNILASFVDAQSIAALSYSLQDAWLDADGDGTPNELNDGSRASQRGFAYANTLGENWAPHIFTVEPPEVITNNSGLIQADVRDNQKVSLVWAVVYPPGYVPPDAQEELQVETLDNFILSETGDADQYVGRFSGFTQEGTYRILVHAEDNDGFKARPVEVEVVVGGTERLYLPLVVE